MTIRTAEKFMNTFSTRKGIRQGCVMRKSPRSFNLYITDIDRKQKEKGIGSLAVNNDRV